MQLVINGLVIGSIIAITAIGLSMIYKTLNFVNFAHGDFVAFAAYIALFANTSGMHLASAFLVAILATIVLGVFMEKVVWLPMRRNRASRPIADPPEPCRHRSPVARRRQNRTR